MLWITESPENLTILIPPEVENVKPTKETSLSLNSMMLNQEVFLPWLPLWLDNPSPLLLMPITFNSILLEFSKIVKLLLITELLLLDIPLMLGLLKTHGEPVGEKKDILD